MESSDFDDLNFIFSKKILFFQKTFFFLLCSPIFGGHPISPILFQIRGAALSRRSLDIFQLSIISNFILHKLHFNIRSIFTTLFSCKLDERENLLKNVYNSGCNFFSVEPLTHCVSQVVKCTINREIYISRHHDGVSFPYDSIIIIVKIHVNYKIVFS